MTSWPRLKLEHTLLAGLIAFCALWDLWAILVDQRLSLAADNFTYGLAEMLRLPQAALLHKWSTDKAPLIYALAFAMEWAVGSLPAATRLICVIGHGCLVAQAYHLGRTLDRGRGAGLWAALVCATTPMVFGWSRLDFTDLPAACFVMAFLQLALETPGALERPRRAGLFGLVIGLGMMTKLSFLVFVVGPGLWLLAARIRGPRVTRGLGLALVVAALVAGPWLVHNTGALVNITVAASVQSQESLWLRVARYLQLPGAWPLLAAAAASLALLGLERRLDRWKLVLLAIAVALPIPLLVVLHEFMARYAVPLFPPCAVLVGAGIASLLARLSPPRRRLTSLAGAAALLAGFVGLNITGIEAADREMSAGMVGPDRRPHLGYARAMAALDRRRPAFLVVGDCEAFEVFRPVAELWAYRGLRAPSSSLAAVVGQRPHAVPVLVVRSRHRPLDLEHGPAPGDCPDAPELSRHLAWLARAARQELVRTEDPYGLVYSALRVNPATSGGN